ncbi:putative reverse transcriptase domain-containing protein [Tanacetum coccineum]
MANIRTCNKHNMIACVEKTAHNADFYQIIDYLTGCSINYSLLVDPDLIGPWLQQFWATASLRVINEVPHIRAMVAGKRVLISEETIRADLLFDDADGVDCFPKQVIWDSLRDIGYEGNLAQLTFSKPLFSPQWKYLVHVLLHCLSAKSTSWEEFGTNIASALVGLATNQKFNFSLMIMNGMLGHIANESNSPKFSCRITPLTPPMLEVVTALAAEEAQSESPHLRAASSRGSLKDPYSREVRRLKKQTISQAKQIHKLKVKLKKLSKRVEPVVKHHTFWVQRENLKKRRRKQRKKQRKKMSSVKLGRNKDEGNLSEEHHDQDDHTAFVYEGFDATEAAVTPDFERKSDETEALERKSDETEQVAIEEEKDASDVKSGDTEELDLEEIQSTARQSVVTPRTLNFEDEAGPSSPIHQTQEEEPKEQFKDDELLADILLNRPRGLSIPGPMQSQPQQPSQASDPKEKGKGILIEEPKKKKLSLQQIRALETTNDEEVARKVQAEWDAEEERKRLEDLKKPTPKPKTISKKSTSLAQERNQMMSFLKGQGYKNVQKLRYPQMKELYDRVQESIKDSFKDFIPIGSEKEKQMLQERDAKRLLRKRKATVTEEQPSKKLKLRTETIDELRNYLRIVDFEKSAQDRESLEAISMITEFKVIDSPDGEYLIIYRANTHFRAFDTLWEILHILDRQDLHHLYLVIMSPRMRTQSAGRPVIESRGGGMGERVGRGGRGRGPRGEPLTRHFSSGCSYKGFLACNPKEYDGKGGAVVLTRWIEKMEFMQDMSGCSIEQKVKYTAGSFVEECCPSHEMQKLETKLWNHVMISGALIDEAVRNGSTKKVEKRGNVGEPSKDKNGRDDNKRNRTGNAFATTVNPVGRENMGAWPKCAPTTPTMHSKGLVALASTGSGCGNQGNKARGRAFMLGAEEARQDLNIVTGTFTLNKNFATTLFDSSADYSFVSTTFIPLLGLEPIDLGFKCEIEIASGQLVEIDKVIKGSKLEIEGHIFDIDLIPFGHRSFDVIIGMDWLSNYKAEIICHEKVVRIPLPDGNMLRVLGERPEEKVRFLMGVKKQEEIVVLRDFLEVFPNDLSGLPPIREIVFRIELTPGATPVAKSPYRLAPSELEELSGQLKEL